VAYQYILLPDAQQEFESSIIHYNENSWLAADRFIEAFDKALELICNHPHRWRLGYASFRELGLKKFPYAIVYTVDDTHQLVVVTAIYHQSRDPTRKYRK